MGKHGWKELKKISCKIMRISLGFVYLRKDITAFNVGMSSAGLALWLYIHSKCKVKRNQLLQMLTCLLKESCCCFKSLLVCSGQFVKEL